MPVRAIVGDRGPKIRPSRGIPARARAGGRIRQRLVKRVSRGPKGPAARPSPPRISAGRREFPLFLFGETGPAVVRGADRGGAARGPCCRWCGIERGLQLVSAVLELLDGHEAFAESFATRRFVERLAELP